MGPFYWRRVGHARFYRTSYSTLEIRSTEREKAHGNPVPGLADRYHYHHGLKAGENGAGSDKSFVCHSMLPGSIKKGGQHAKDSP